MLRRILAAFTFLILFGIAGPMAANGPTYPNKPIHLIVAYPPGGATDIIGRLLAEVLGNRLGQRIIVENRGGASGMEGARYAARSAPDGYTLLYGSTTSIVTSPPVIMKSPYSGRTDFEPITAFGRIDGLLVVPANSKYRTSQELADALKANPGKLNYGTIGPGSMSHLSGELFLRVVGAKATPVAYKGPPAAVSALVAGEIDFLFDSIAGSGALVDAGRLRALGVATNKRLPQLPDVPTLTEAGLKLVIGVWLGLFAPKGTPRPILDQWAQYARDYFRDADVRSKMLARGVEPIPSTPQEFARQIAADEALWWPLIKSLNIQA